MQTKCEALTKTNKDGRVYQAIVGQFVKEKAHMRIIEDLGPTRYSSEFTLSNGNNEVTLHSGSMTDKTAYQKYVTKLQTIVYSHRNEENFSSYTYGICGYKNENGKYFDQIDTLTLIEGQKKSSDKAAP